jgi:hypothetical protein
MLTCCKSHGHGRLTFRGPRLRWRLSAPEVSADEPEWGYCFTVGGLTHSLFERNLFKRQAIEFMIGKQPDHQMSRRRLTDFYRASVAGLSDGGTVQVVGRKLTPGARMKRLLHTLHDSDVIASFPHWSNDCDLALSKPPLEG